MNKGKEMETCNQQVVFIDIMKLIGFLFMIVATIISIVTIPSFDKRIAKLNSDIDSFKDSRIMTSTCLLAYKQDFVKRRIELFERNQLILHGSSQEAINEIEKRTLDDTIKLAQQYAVLLGEDQADQFLKDTNEKINQVVRNEKRSLVEKIDLVEKIWKDNINAASIRNKERHAKWKENETAKTNLEKRRNYLNGWFIACQLSGLILFTGAEVLSKLLMIFLKQHG